ncbi:MAG: putative glycolipid-binding domain-containing protein [Bacillota bacterium]|nr:MAG: hypothetical protein DIU55_11420 [Bacillota bacterium]
MERSLRWSAIGSAETEELVLRTEAGGIVAESVVKGMSADRPLRVAYRLELDPAWQVLRVAVQAGDRELRLRRDPDGTWHDGRGAPLPDLAGCIDVDISVTPFTNTLPIRRLQLAPGQSAEIRVAYIQVPELLVRPVRQRYTNTGGGRYRYEALETGFTTLLSVDDDGLVLEYPGCFRRVH